MRLIHAERTLTLNLIRNARLRGFFHSQEAHMKQVHKRLLVTTLLATFGIVGMAQTPPAAPGGHEHGSPMMGHMAGHGDSAKMAEHHKEHLAALKAKLKLTSAQEGAWTTFTTATQPPAHTKADREALHAEMSKLTTPERIDKMQTLKTQRDTEMTQHANAVKAFYAQLTPEQQKVFDSESLHHHGQHSGAHDGHGMGAGKGMMGN